jgi:hypothetical protein
MLPNSNEIRELEAAGITVMRFCGIPVAQIDENHYLGCDREAVGELTFIVEDEELGTTPVNVPVCAEHLEELRKEKPIEELDTPGAILLD